MAATSNVVVVLDGATTRTETGCVHGVAWYVQRLGIALLTRAVDKDSPLPGVLAGAIEEVAAAHPQCDLTHPGTPSAAVGLVRWQTPTIELAVLGDVTIVLDEHLLGLRTITDDRVSRTALWRRQAANEHPIGSAAKQDALVAMKHAELAARNRDDGYWIAAATPTAADHAFYHVVPVEQVRQLAVLTDGAARYADLFHPGSWTAVLQILRGGGPDRLIDQIRTMEQHDPTGRHYPRNKASDDATIVYWHPSPSPAPVVPVPHPELTAVPAGLMGACPPFPDRVPIPRTE